MPKAKRPTKATAPKVKKSGAGALFIPAGILFGMGMGFLFGNLPAGLFIGLGLGMAIFAILEVLKNK